MWYLESDNYREFHTYTSSSVNEFLAWDTDKMMKPQKEIIVEVFGKIEYIKVTSN